MTKSQPKHLHGHATCYETSLFIATLSCHPNGQLRLKTTAFLLCSCNAWLGAKTEGQWCCRPLEARSVDGFRIHPPWPALTWPPCWGGERRPSLQRQNPNSLPTLTSIHCLEIFTTAVVDLNSPGRKRYACVTLAKQVCTNILSGTMLQSLKVAPPSNANYIFQN